MLVQQATTLRLEDSVAKINSEVATLQTVLKKMSEEVGHSTQPGKGK